MDLYRFEAVLENSIVPIVVVAESEEKAFKMAEIELENIFTVTRGKGDCFI